jgi:hypothetical protein
VTNLWDGGSTPKTVLPRGSLPRIHQRFTRDRSHKLVSLTDGVRGGRVDHGGADDRCSEGKRSAETGVGGAADGPSLRLRGGSRQMRDYKIIKWEFHDDVAIFSLSIVLTAPFLFLGTTHSFTNP